MRMSKSRSRKPEPPASPRSSQPAGQPAGPDRSPTATRHPFEPETGWFGIPRERIPLLVLFVSVTLGTFFVWSWFSRKPDLDEYTYELVATHPHDTRSFTQGLLFHKGHLYESTGRLGESRLRKIDLKSGEVVKNVDLDPDLFGEGLALVGDRLVQVTWQNRVGIVYDLDLNEIERFRTDDDCWGLTFDGRQLILSDGTSTLRFLNPATFEVEREVSVHRGGSRLGNINELEYINGLIYANVWKEDSIYQIQPHDGKVLGRIDLRDLYPYNDRKSSEEVLNGIAIHPGTGNLLVTGKYWPQVYEIKPIRRP